MQLEFVGKLIGMFVDRILDEVFPKETGAARLQQVGLFTLIFVLEQRGETVTSVRLAELTGQARSSIHKQIEKLERVNVIKRRKSRAKHGRGLVYHLSIKHTPKTKRLIEAIEGDHRDRRMG
jgi:DNA-binding MarR family transcriptional regulator